jgi:hypothetical protein
MDKIDGPYYFFKAIQKVRGSIPQWFPLVGIEVGKTNIVPVDYVAAAMDHIAHQPGLDGQAFHLVNPKRQAAGDVLNSSRGPATLPRWRCGRQEAHGHAADRRLGYAMKLAAAQAVPQDGPRRLRHPGHRDPVHGPDGDLRRPRNPARAGRHGDRGPRARRVRVELLGLLERHLDPDLFRDSSSRARSTADRVITGASSGIGRARR